MQELRKSQNQDLRADPDVERELREDPIPETFLASGV